MTTTPISRRNSRLAERLIQKLRQRHYDAYYCEGREALLNQVKALIPEGSTVA